jgi:hypothetical protein
MIYPKVKYKPSSEGRPATHPIPAEDGQLFYIQRNLSKNSVIYSINTTPGGLINLDNPMNVYWIRYEDNMHIKPLNFMQKELAYGYSSVAISSEVIKFRFVCYNKDFFIIKVKDQFQVISIFDNENYVVNSVFVHAEESGAFPVIHFVEFDLDHLETGCSRKYRIEFLN